MDRQNHTEPPAVKQLKIDFDKEITFAIQSYLMGLLNTSDIIYDVEGEIVSEVVASSYCKTLRFVSERKDLCLSYSRELSKSAMHYNKPFEEQCPGGIVILALPIYFEENTIVGAHCVSISNPYRSKFSVFDVASQFNIDANILWDAVKKTFPTPKPILKIAREQAILATELLSKVIARIYSLRESELSLAKKFHSIEEIVKRDGE